MGELQRTYRGRATPRDERDGPATRERAILIASMDGAPERVEDSLEELEALLDTAGATAEARLVQRRDRPDPRTYLGSGKLTELKELVVASKPDLVAAATELTPGQQRHLEDALSVRVVDRTAVILDIFAQHAKTAEGKLQVELAQLEYSYARQEGLWQHLERLGGGVGTRGPGETQLESDRRMVRNRMGALRRRLRGVARSRETMRQRRATSATPRVALAGYTNAGKSSLMNALTGADTSVDDALFETLDPTTRALEVDRHRVLLSDTVGFVRDLPHLLVEAFMSTLDEVREADLLLHVADATESDERRRIQAEAVASVLDEIGAGEIPRILVLNKVDRLGEEERVALGRRFPDAVLVSARTGLGLDELRARLAELARSRLTPVDVTIPYSRGELLSSVYSLGREVAEEATPEGTRMRALMPPPAAARLLDALGARPRREERTA